MTRSPFWRLVVANFVLAVVIATVIGSIMQTQFNLAAISGLGVDISLRERIGTTLFDLGSFTPIWGTMVAATLLVALPAAALVARLLPALRAGLFFAAGAVGILVALLVADALLPMPTFIGATRGVFGMLVMMLSVGVGAWLFARMVWRPYAARITR